MVTAGKFEQRVGEVSQSLSVLRPEVIQNKNITNVSEVLGQVPGVATIDEDPHPCQQRFQLRRGKPRDGPRGRPTRVER